VLKVLGIPPRARCGWWIDEHQFDIEFKVWVLQRRGARASSGRKTDSPYYETEADKHQSGLPN
jgi:hypothetical protein